MKFTFNVNGGLREKPLIFTGSCGIHHYSPGQSESPDRVPDKSRTALQSNRISVDDLTHKTGLKV